MDNGLKKEFANWFARFRKEHKTQWSTDCDIKFMQTTRNFDRLIKKTEKDVYKKIDKEITSKKQDRGLLTKAIRLSKNKDTKPKYIDLRFEELWDEALEKIIEPYIYSETKIISQIQYSYIDQIQSNDPGAKTFEQFDPKKDPRFK